MRRSKRPSVSASVGICSNVGSSDRSPTASTGHDIPTLPTLTTALHSIPSVPTLTSSGHSIPTLPALTASGGHNSHDITRFTLQHLLVTMENGCVQQECTQVLPVQSVAQSALDFRTRMKPLTQPKKVGYLY
nr:uncharacterized protein LOC128700455 [Cherax quadricarinatus]